MKELCSCLECGQVCVTYDVTRFGGSGLRDPQYVEIVVIQEMIGWEWMLRQGYGWRNGSGHECPIELLIQMKEATECGRKTSATTGRRSRS